MKEKVWLMSKQPWLSDGSWVLVTLLKSFFTNVFHLWLLMEKCFQLQKNSEHLSVQSGIFHM